MTETMSRGTGIHRRLVAALFATPMLVIGCGADQAPLTTSTDMAPLQAAIGAGASASAGVSFTTVSLNGAPATSVASGASINATVSGEVSFDDWLDYLGSISLKVHLDGADPATAVQLVCFDMDPDVLGQAPFDAAFAFNAPNGPGVYDVILSAYLYDDCSDELSSSTFDQALTVQGATNQPPAADARGPYTGAEGADIALDGTGSGDTDGAVVGYAWSWEVVAAGPGAACTMANAATPAPSFNCDQNGSYLVRLTVTDDDGAASTVSTAGVTVTNALPGITGLALTPDHGLVYSLSEPVTVTAAWSDAGVLDTQTCRAVAAADGGAPVHGSDGSALAGGSGDCSSTLNFTDPGVYAVTMTVTDADGGAASAQVEVVVTDPAAGFVTGGGWIDSPKGAYLADPELAGRMTFRFVSEYRGGEVVPTGDTELQFRAGSLVFHSKSHQWLVVHRAAGNAQLRSNGRVNGRDGYSILLRATDGGRVDRLRVQIFEDATGAMIYDNGADQEIGGGSIVIHARKSR